VAVVAVPDLHGRLDLLEAVLAAYPGRDLVFLGDYIDGGPASREVVARVLALADEGRARLLLGNHELMALDATREGEGARRLWLTSGGDATVRSYLKGSGPAGLDLFAKHLTRLFELGLPWLIEDGVLYAHAARPNAAALAGSDEARGHYWASDREPRQPLPEGCHLSVHGHTPQLRPSLNPERGVCYLDLGGKGIAVYDAATGEVRRFSAPRPNGRRSAYR
jgi:serine/threonine protein phosphatase 1